MTRTAALLLVLAPAMAAQPVISPGGVVNAASFQAPSSPGGALAQGSILSIFGTGLGPPLPGVGVCRFPLDTNLAGVSVRLVHSSGQTLSAIPLFAGATQINAILPSTTPIGLVSVSVAYNGRAGSSETVKVVRSSLGLFAVAQNYISPSSQPVNSPTRPAVPGQTVILWGTGLGPAAAPDNTVPVPENRSDPLELTLAGRPVPVDYQGRSGCCAGVDQISFRIPDTAPPGCAVPLQVKLHNGIFSNLFQIAISPDGAPCDDGRNLPASAGRWGLVSLLPDAATAQFLEAEPPAGFPPPGSCAATRIQGLFARPLSAGPGLTLNGPRGNTALMPQGPGIYTAPSPVTLPPGTYTLDAPGGPDVGAFRASLNVPSGFSWTTISGSRSSGLTVTYAGAELVTISGPSFFCTAPGTPGSFTVSPAILANLPVQVPVEVAGVSQILFSAPGLDRGLFRYSAAVARSVSLGDPLLAATPVRLPDGRSILAELALTSAEQQRGLMQRSELPPDRGMLFPYDRPQMLSFWMFGTLIPLDITWLDSARRIIFISANTPPCRSDPSACPVYGPREVSQFVLELAAGQVARLGLRLGDRLDW